MPEMTAEQTAALIRAMEEAKAGYAPVCDDLIRHNYYVGIMHGLQHAIDIVRRARDRRGVDRKMYEELPPAERGDG
jgi:hypothetical protein